MSASQFEKEKNRQLNVFCVFRVIIVNLFKHATRDFIQFTHSVRA